MKRILAFLIICAFLGNGCAQYKRPPLMVKVPDFYEHKTKIHQLTVVADPYFEASRNEYIFNSDLTKKGFLPVHFIAFNFGERSYDLSNARFVLVREDGVEITPMDPKQVSKKVLKHTSLRMLGWGFAGLIILSIPFSLVAGMDSFRANKTTRQAIKEDVLKVFDVGPKEAIDGFYFFQLGKRSREIREALGKRYEFRLEGLVDQSTGQAYDLVIGIT